MRRLFHSIKFRFHLIMYKYYFWRINRRFKKLLKACDKQNNEFERLIGRLEK